MFSHIRCVQHVPGYDLRGGEIVGMLKIMIEIRVTRRAIELIQNRGVCHA